MDAVLSSVEAKADALVAEYGLSPGLLISGLAAALFAVLVHFVFLRKAKVVYLKDVKAGSAAILAVGTANPPFEWSGEKYDKYLQQQLKGVVSDKYIEFFGRRNANSGIKKRATVISEAEFSAENMAKSVEERDGLFAGAKKEYFNPSAKERHAMWDLWAPKLATQAAAECIKNWGGDKTTITHVIFHSCTGFKAPGIELDIVDNLELTGVKRRTGINYMGCFGGFTGLAVAKAFAESNPGAKVLVVCCELCSLHLTLSENRSEMIGNTIFADGAAACLVGPGGVGDWAIQAQRTITLGKETRAEMSWAPSDFAYHMYLDKGISNSLGKYLVFNLKSILEDVTGTRDRSEVEWAVHPGGKAILEAFEDPKYMVNLTKHDLRHSYSIMENHGNMSSPTIFFVIKHLFDDPTVTRKKVFALGFGPGLTVEAAGLAKIEA